MEQVKTALTEDCLEVQLTFPPEISNEPLVCHLVRDYNLTFTILAARITPRKEGHLTLQLIGQAEDIQASVDFLKTEGVKVTGIAQKVIRHDDVCMHCGTCTALCAAKALRVDPQSRLVCFDVQQCTACGLCVRVCPVRAMVLQVQQGKL
ncbi:MAG: NIL domain-containing protein [Desulfovibrionaceae bacterium]